MECHKTKEHTAFPVFYDVDPSEVRKQNGSVREALNMLKNKNETEVKKWREALTEAANLSGWDLKNTADGHEAKVIKLIVERVFSALPSIDTTVDENLVGMEKRMQDLLSRLNIGSNDVHMIGIKGMGGAGKTTLAHAIFDKISIKFEGSSFVENVRERSSQSGLKKLQKQVLADVLKDKNITVLIVLDDVDGAEQLEKLVGDPNWFKPGSRIIITTRDEQVLNIYTVKWIIDVNLLSDEEAIRLFSRHAFRRNFPTQEFEMESCQVVRYAAGLPLTLKVLGSNLHGENKPKWKDALARLKTISLKETLKILEVSYESLEDDCKQIFLDVACFLRHWRKDDAIRMLESCGFHAVNGLRVLEQKSLIKIVGTFQGGDIIMHDHIIEMGENIVRREHPDEPNRRSRLWVREEIECVLANGLVAEATSCIIDFKITPGIVLENLGNMKELRCLIVNSKNYYLSEVEGYSMINEDCQYFSNSLQYLCFKHYPHWCLPKTFEANNLVTLNMSESKIKQLWEGDKVMKKLKFLFLRETKLKSLDLRFTPSLERLDVGHCHDLVTINVDGGCLKSLVYLNLRYCESLKSFLFIEQLESLEVLHMNDLDLEEFPDYIITGHSKNSLLELNLSVNDIEEVPSSIGNIHKLVSLNLTHCHRVKSLPASICSLQHLRTLIVYCIGIEELPDDLGQLKCLENLDLSCTKVKHLPGSICMLIHLKTLILQRCRFLEMLPQDVGLLESLEELDLKHCSNLKDIPSSIGKLKHLEVLMLEGCRSLEKLPDDLGDLESLQFLDIEDTCITHLPPSIYLLEGLTIKRSEDEDFIQSCFKYYSIQYSIPGLHQIQCFQHLRILSLRGPGIQELPESLGHLVRLEYLCLSYTDVKHLPDSICKLKHLKKLILQRCILLEKLPGNVGQLESLEKLNLSKCYSIRDIPSSICMLKQLKILDLWHCFCLEKLPQDIGQLESLEKLYITRCYNITQIPSSICMLTRLKRLRLEGCRTLEKPSPELEDYIFGILA